MPDLLLIWWGSPKFFVQYHTRREVDLWRSLDHALETAPADINLSVCKGIFFHQSKLFLRLK